MLNPIVTKLFSLSITGFFISIFIVPTVPPPTSTSPFGAHFWELESSTIRPALDIDDDGIPDVDLLKIFPDCERDDANQYRSDGTVLTDRGKVRCDDNDEQQEETGTWSFDSDSKKLMVKKYDSRKVSMASLSERTATRLIFVSQIESGMGTHTIKTVMRTK